MVGLVALLVIGPERLPKVARLIGFWIGKTRNIVASVKEEIKEELHAEELRQMLKDQAGSLEDLQDVLAEMDSSAHALKNTLDKRAQQIEQSIKSPHEK